MQRTAAPAQVQGCNRTSSRVAANPNVHCTCPLSLMHTDYPWKRRFTHKDSMVCAGVTFLSGWTFGPEQSYCSSLTLDYFEHFLVAEHRIILWPLCWTLFFMLFFFILEPFFVTQFRACTCNIFCTHSHLYLLWNTWSGDTIILNMAHIWRQRWQNFK